MNNIIKCTGSDWKNKGREEVYRFPDKWDIREYKIKSIPELSDSIISDTISGEFVYKGKKTILKEIAKNKKKVIILVDDLSRFTPSFKIAPTIIGQLLSANVQKENIRFIIAVGSHKQLTREEMALKLGEEIVNEYSIENHDCINDEMEYLGDNSYGTPVRINKKAADADLVIGIGSLNKHRFAYGSGGAKIILPGVSHIDTIRHNHRFQADVYSDPKDRFGKLRGGMNEAAGLLSGKTDFIVVNVALNQNRDVIDIFIGDCIDVFAKNIDKIFNNYIIDYDKKLFGRNRKAEIGIFRVDTLDPLQIGKSILNWHSACRIPIVTGYFGKHIYQGSAYGTYEDYLNKYNNTVIPAQSSLREAIDYRKTIIYSENLDAKSAVMWNAEYYVTKNWAELIGVLGDIFGKKVKVAFFHDAYFQIIDKKIIFKFIKNKFLRKLIDHGISFLKRIMRLKNRIFRKPAPPAVNRE